MDLIRKILIPFSFLYGEIVGLRNIAFDNGWFSSRRFDIPVIVVGNLNVGGTGKSPQIENLVRLLFENYRIAILSRGYKRKSKGFQLADKNSTANELGDEPLQFYKKFKNIYVAVDADRVNGITELQNLNLPPDIVLLDDAFQHRKVNAGFSILLTSYNDLYVDDYMLPTGFLREKKKGARRANLIVISKCPMNLTDKKKSEIIKKLNVCNNQSVFFSSITYNDKIIGWNDQIKISALREFSILLVTGIANSNPLIEFLDKSNLRFTHMKYKDHHDFTIQDKEKIISEFDNIEANKKIILTTEKDYVRSFSQENKNIYYLPIRSQIIEKEMEFNKLILNYVQKGKRNGKLFN